MKEKSFKKHNTSNQKQCDTGNVPDVETIKQTALLDKLNAISNNLGLSYAIYQK